MWILCSDKYSPLVRDCFLVVIVDVAGVFIAIIIVPNLYIEFKSFILVESGSHEILQVRFELEWELLLYNLLKVLINIIMVILCLEIVRNFSSAHWAGRLVLEVSSHALDTETVAARQDA